MTGLSSNFDFADFCSTVTEIRALHFLKPSVFRILELQNQKSEKEDVGNMLANAFSGLSKVVNKIATLSNAVGTLVLLALVVVINYDIIARGIFNLPFRGAIEVVQFCMVLIVFLQLPDVVRVGKLTRSDGLLILIKDRYPRVSRLLNLFINLLSASVMALVTVAIFPEFLDMWETDDFFGIPGVFTAPWWPIKLTVLCSAALCTIIFFLKTCVAEDKPDSKEAINKDTTE